MFEMKISDIRNNKRTVAVVIVLMIFSLPSNLIFITTTEDLTYSSAVQDFYLLPPASLLHYEFTGNQITSQLAVQSSLGVTLQHFSGGGWKLNFCTLDEIEFTKQSLHVP